LCGEGGHGLSWSRKKRRFKSIEEWMAELVEEKTVAFLGKKTGYFKKSLKIFSTEICWFDNFSVMSSKKAKTLN